VCVFVYVMMLGVRLKEYERCVYVYLCVCVFLGGFWGVRVCACAMI